MNRNRLVIAGAGGHGREVIAIARAMDLEIEGVVDDGEPDLPALAALGVTLLGRMDVLHDAGGRFNFAVGLGYPEPRRLVASRIASWGLQVASLVHPSATVGPAVEMAEGVIVWPQATVTAQSRLGRHTHLNVASSVSHDCVLGDFVTVGPGARVCGGVNLSDDVWIGAGATVIHGVSIGTGTVVGAGAVVITDLPDGVVATGVPARIRTSGSAGSEH